MEKLKKTEGSPSLLSAIAVVTAFELLLATFKTFATEVTCGKGKDWARPSCSCTLGVARCVFLLRQEETLEIAADFDVVNDAPYCQLVPNAGSD